MPSAEEMNFTLHTCSKPGKLYAAVLTCINDHLSGNHGPSMLVWESNVSVESVLGSAMAIRRLPIVTLSFYMPDANFPSTHWQLPALKMATARCGALALWMQQRIELSKWAQIPLGDWNTDWVLQAADTFFARALRSNQQVLWIGKNGTPDLGIGQEPQEEARLMTSILDTDAFASSSNNRSAALPTEVSNPGAYRSVCVELKLEHLAVSAIDNAIYLDEMEEFQLLGNAQGSSNTLAGTEQAAANAFKVLQELVSSWLRSALQEHNQHADALLYQLHRWLSSPSSKLRDPALQHLVTLCMRKVFSLLISEVKKLGAYVIRADFSSMWLCTGKSSPSEATSYTEFLRKTLGNRKLFRWLSLTCVRYWHCLLFRDKYNFSSILVNEDDPCAESMKPSQACLTADWDIASFLPPVLKPHFEAVMSEFLFRPWEDEFKAVETGTDNDSGNHASEDAMRKRVDGFVRGQLTERLLRMVQDIDKHVTQGSDAPKEHMFPERVGSHLPAKQLGTPALAFAKFVCHALSLDHRCESAVKLLRKNLLKALHVHEFAPEAEFKEPCITYLLQGVICNYCNDCRDIDLCRDQEVNNADVTLAERWRCSNLRCRQLYDLDAIERMLISRVRWRAKAYQLQDLRCVRCRNVKATHVASMCECGGSFELIMSAEALRQWTCIFERIGEFHGFELLRQTASWLAHSHE